MGKIWDAIVVCKWQRHSRHQTDGALMLVKILSGRFNPYKACTRSFGKSGFNLDVIWIKRPPRNTIRGAKAISRHRMLLKRQLFSILKHDSSKVLSFLHYRSRMDIPWWRTYPRSIWSPIGHSNTFSSCTRMTSR